MDTETLDRNRPIALILGNGTYASDLLDMAKAEFQRVELITLLPYELTNVGNAEAAHFTYQTLHEIVPYLHEKNVHDVIFAGDFGLNRATSILTEFAKGIWDGGFIRNYIYNHIGSPNTFGVVTFLQFIERMFLNAGIRPWRTSSVFPVLKPDCGVILDCGNLPADTTRSSIFRQTIERLSTQPKLRVRQTLAFDDEVLIGEEWESTDRLLRAIRGIPKPAFAIRSIVKLSPPDISSTIDAPVVGPDTIDHCHVAKVDGVYIDCKNGVISRIKPFLGLSRAYDISIVGIDTTTIKLPQI